MDAKSEPERACAKRIPADQFFLNIILRLLTKDILQLQNLKLKESIYRYYRLDQNYVKTRKNNTAVVIIRTTTIDRPAN